MEILKTFQKDEDEWCTLGRPFTQMRTAHSIKNNTWSYLNPWENSWVTKYLWKRELELMLRSFLYLEPRRRVSEDDNVHPWMKICVRVTHKIFYRHGEPESNFIYIFLSLNKKKKVPYMELAHEIESVIKKMVNPVAGEIWCSQSLQVEEIHIMLHPLPTALGWNWKPALTSRYDGDARRGLRKYRPWMADGKWPLQLPIKSIFLSFHNVNLEGRGPS